jgi:hypothetical protein
MLSIIPIVYETSSQSIEHIRISLIRVIRVIRGQNNRARGNES